MRVACSNCGRELRTGARFCDGCGAALKEVESPQSRVKSGESGNSRLSAFGSRLARGAHSYTPKHLAYKILQSKSALEGERKQVTVLFADVKGSMELARESVDSLQSRVERAQTPNSQLSTLNFFPPTVCTASKAR